MSTKVVIHKSMLSAHKTSALDLKSKPIITGKYFRYYFPQAWSLRKLFSGPCIHFRQGIAFSSLFFISLASCVPGNNQTTISTSAISNEITESFNFATETQGGSNGPAFDTSFEQMGVSVRMVATPLSTGEGRNVLYAGDDVEIRIEITDTTTHTPLSNLSIGTWIDGRYQDVDASCQDKIESFLTGSLSARPEYDLNAFYVLAMNDEASITVVDPLFSFGGSRLLAFIQLPSPGEDWVLSEDGNRLYVTLPLINQVAIIDTRTWKTKNLIRVGTQPTRLRLQPDEKYLWVSCLHQSADGQRGIVSIIDTDTEKLTKNLLIGDGHHDIVFDQDSRNAFISNQESASVHVVDVQTLQVDAQIDIGKSAGSMTYSTVSQSVYVVDGVGGEVVVIDGYTHEITSRIKDAPGLGTIKTVPGDRFLMVVNSRQDTVHVIDVANDRIIQTADVEPEPSQITFTLKLAYILSKGSEIVDMIPLELLGTGRPLSVFDFTGGHIPFGYESMPSLADRIVPGPSGLSTIIANPIDKSIYYYKEGMATPMGHFSNYGREPRATMVIDRSMKESSTGVYTTTVLLERSGFFDVAILLDIPRLTHCFEIEVKERPGAPVVKSSKPLLIEPLIQRTEIAVGQPIKLRYRVTDSATGKPLEDLKDLNILTFNTSNWQQRHQAHHTHKGIYEVTFVPPATGVYYASCRIPSWGMQFKDLPIVALKAVDTRN